MNKIEKVETVFKDGMGYDPVELIESCGQMGLQLRNRAIERSADRAIG